MRNEDCRIIWGESYTHTAVYAFYSPESRIKSRMNNCEYIAKHVSDTDESFSISDDEDLLDLLHLSKLRKLKWIEADTKFFVSIDGVLYDREMKTLIRYPQNKDGAVFTVPEGISTIEWYAFSGATHLTSIKLPGGTTEIGSRAFMNCTNLTKIEIPQTATTIGSRAFSGCASLVDICLPSSVFEIGHRAFSHCTSLERVNIPENVRHIPPRCFACCTNLREVVCHSKLESIDYEAFDKCMKLAQEPSVIANEKRE